MTTPSGQPEPTDGRPPAGGAPDRLESTLRRSLATEPASERFVAELAEKLAAEHALVMASTVESTEPQPAPTRWRVPAWAALAACFLMMIVWGTSNPSSGWAAMIEAIAQRDWVAVVTELSPTRRAEAWFSESRRQIAIRSDGRARLDDHASGKRFSIGRADGELIERPLDGSANSSVESRFLCAVLNGSSDEPIHAESLRYEIVEEASRPLDDDQLQVEVLLRILNPPEREYRLQFTVDSQTNLPSTGRAQRGAVTQPISFTYPKAGPIAAGVTNFAESPFFTLPPIASSSETSALADATEQSVVGLSESQPVALIRPTTTPDRVAIDSKPESIKREPRPPAEPLPPPRSIEAMASRVDDLLRDHWDEQGLKPTGRAGDYEFLRRAHLDLTGRIPSVNAVRTFMADEDPDRRERLIDDLVGRYDHASHLATVWRKFLIPDPDEIAALGGAPAFEEWLTDRFRKNAPYDRLAADLLLAEGRMTDGGAMLFYAASKLQPEVIARQTSRVFLGVRMDCAQCHDDFFDERWSQRDFWSFAAFFAQISQPESMVARVSPVMRVKDIERGSVKLPDSEEVIPPSFPLEAFEPTDGEETSRRQQLVDWLTDPRNPHFARATVNRAWAVLFGRGLVNPLDDMRPDNPPDCPQLLDELTTYFLRTEFDLRRLLVTLSRTEAYQLSSVATEDAPERRRHFAQMNIKPFTPEQLYDGIVTATRLSAGRAPAAMTVVEGVPVDALNLRNDNSRRAFLERFKLTPGEATEYQAGITQALALMNGRLTDAATGLGSSGLLKSLRAPFMNDKQRVEVLFLATVSRPPSDEESEAILGMLSEARGKRERSEVLGDALWALLNSAEFTLNH